MTTLAKKTVPPTEAKKTVPPAEQKSLIKEMAAKYHVAPEKFMATLKSTAFQQKPGQEITDEQMLMLLTVANEYSLNPFLKQIYAFPDKHKGIIPIVGVDGYIRIVNEHPQADGWEYRISPEMVDVDQFVSGVPEWIECVMYRKDRQHPTVARVYMAESYRPPFETKSKHQLKGPWQTYPRLMLENRAFIRAARFAFGFTGIFSEDDAERMQEQEYIDAEVVTDPPARPSEEPQAEEEVDGGVDPFMADYDAQKAAEGAGKTE